MNIKELKTAIANLPDDAPVLLSNGDHGYYELCSIRDKTALKEVTESNGKRRTTWTEDILIGEIGVHTEYGERVAALCLT